MTGATKKAELQLTDQHERPRLVTETHTSPCPCFHDQIASA